MGLRVVIISGGIDSSTLLYKLAQEEEHLKALTFLYGQRHRREVEAARALASRAGIALREVDLNPLGVLLRSALTDPTAEIPEVPASAEHYETLKQTVVPNRNAIFLAVAVGYATSLGANRVYFGAHHSDRGVYPDCRREFIEAFTAAERLATDNPHLTIEAPFLDMDKSAIVKLGRRLGVPYELTWSCYKGGERHCGVCSSCRERKRAFLEVGVIDPTIYQK